MGLKLLRFSIEGLKIFANERLEINFLNEKRVSTGQAAEHVVEKLSQSVYKNNVMAIAGINASGKTTTLNLIKFVMDVFFCGESSNENRALVDLFEEKITIQLYVIHEGMVISHTATLRKNERLEFVEEKTMQKPLRLSETGASLLQFAENSKDLQVTRRSTLGAALKYLKKEDSILPGLLYGARNHPQIYLDTLDSSEAHLLEAAADFDEKLLQYLDPSIESFKRMSSVPASTQITPEKIFFELKFYDSPAKIVSLFELNHYLSAGTIRGLGVFNRIKRVLATGSYLLIDEIELHFNKAIVQSIIQFFQSDVNSKEATLIFSTHYSELLDAVERKDAIKVLRKVKRHIQLDSLSTLAKAVKKDRTDIKNSDLILSGIFATAPVYEKYWRVNRSYKQYAEKRGEQDGDT